MKLILFGGAELGEVAAELKMIESAMRTIKPRQVLHVPFARIIATEEEWQGDWFHRHIKLSLGTKYLNAENPGDLLKARNPLVFISGGGNNLNLLRKIKENPKLLALINNADCIIGESAGAKILGEYFRSKGDDNSSMMMAGLGIISDTVIEPHYTQRQRHELLIKDLEESGVKYGLGIDSMTALEFEVDDFPHKFKKIGSGLVEIRKNN